MLRTFALFCVLLQLTTARPIDTDGNGVPDLCEIEKDLSTKCLGGDGTWKTPPQQEVVYATTSAIPPEMTLVATTPEDITSSALLPTASSLPPGNCLGTSEDFGAAKGTKWNIGYVGDIKFTGELASKQLYGDKCRSSKLGGKIIWNCGDMMCNPDYTICGFAMGPAFYGTDDVMTIDTDGIERVQNNDFLKAWSGDAQPESPQTHWGMDTSNVAAINDTHGVAYARQIWRGAPDGSYADQGNAVASITLGDKMPVATRIGPLLTGPEVAELGLLAILRDGDFIYIYSMGGPSKVTVSRVRATDDVFDRTKYESLVYRPDDLYSTGTWKSGLPAKDGPSTMTSPSNSVQYGMTTLEPSGEFSCSVYGSAFYNNFLKKYTIICNTFMSLTNMYLSDTPYGPWSTGYNLLSNVTGYGSHAHPEYSPDGNHKTIYFSQGPNEKFNMFKVSFDGY